MPKIKLENGKEVNISEESYKELARSIKKELPKSWKDLGEISGYYTDIHSDVYCSDDIRARRYDENIFRTKEQAEASIALAQLSQLMYVYNDGWEPDYSSSEFVYSIYYCDNKIKRSYFTSLSSFLTFEKEEIRDEFLENFRELIETAKPLL